jgi:hypothetical protein
VSKKSDDKLVNRLRTVFENLLTVSKDCGYLQIVKEGLNDLIDEMSRDDLFGTEQQNDPRGDGREVRLSI